MKNLLYESVRPRYFIERDTVDEDGIPVTAIVDASDVGQVIQIMSHNQVMVEFDHGTYKLHNREIERASTPNDQSRYKNPLI